jgi:undecaprenyl-diphosphatase
MLWALLAADSSDPSRVELNLFRLVNQLPTATGPPLIGVMQLGALAALPVVVFVCVVTGRARLGRLAVLGGALGWVAAKGLGAVVAQRPPDERVSGVLLHGAVTPGLAFPSTHVAVAAAVATVASPYVSRSVRRTSWLLVGLVALARLYVGAHLPVDVVGGFALGVMVGSLVHLALGAPRGAPDPEVLRHRFGELGSPMRSVIATSPGGNCFCAEESDGRRLHVRVVDRDGGDADWLYRLWRSLAYREALGGWAAREPAHAADHEALVLLIAARDGLAVPAPEWTEPIADGEYALVREWIPGAGLDARDLETNPWALIGAWQQLDALHRLCIAYGAARLSGFVATDRHGVVPVDFSRARLRADDVSMQRDVANLLASSAAKLGATEAAARACEGIGAAAVASALVVLQPLALSSEVRAEMRQSACSIDELRAAVAVAAGVEVEPVTRPAWVVGRNLAPFALGAVALVVLLAQLGSLSTALTAVRDASPVWLVVAVLCAIAGYVMAAVSMQGAAPEPLALGRTTVVQFAAAFTNRVAPAGLGAMATNVRYLERNGIRRARAANAVGLNAAAGVIVHVLLLFTVVPLAGMHSTVSLPTTPDFSHYWPIVAAILFALSLAGLWYWRNGLGSILERIRPHARDLFGVFAQPRRSLLLFGGSFGVTVAQSFVFVAALEAVGVHRSVLTCMAVFLAGSAIAAAAPTPGGLGALEAALVAGLAQVGVPTAPALAGVLIARVVGYWLPIVPGWFAFRVSVRNGTL